MRDGLITDASKQPQACLSKPCLDPARNPASAVYLFAELATLSIIKIKILQTPGIIESASGTSNVVGGTATFVLYASRALDIVMSTPTTTWYRDNIPQTWSTNARVKETVSQMV